MPLPLRFAFFLTMLGGMTYLTHRYLYRRMVVDLVEAEATRRRGRMLFIGLGVGLLVAMPANRYLPPSVGAYVAYAAYCWMGLLAVLLPLNFAVEPLRLWLARRATRPDNAGALTDPADGSP